MGSSGGGRENAKEALHEGRWGGKGENVQGKGEEKATRYGERGKGLVRKRQRTFGRMSPDRVSSCVSSSLHRLHSMRKPARTPGRAARRGQKVRNRPAVESGNVVESGAAIEASNDESIPQGRDGGRRAVTQPKSARRTPPRNLPPSQPLALATSRLRNFLPSPPCLLASSLRRPQRSSIGPFSIGLLPAAAPFARGRRGLAQRVGGERRKKMALNEPTRCGDRATRRSESPAQEGMEGEGRGALGVGRGRGRGQKGREEEQGEEVALVGGMERWERRLGCRGSFENWAKRRKRRDPPPLKRR